jgi:fatty-acyl-CoA synthase
MRRSVTMSKPTTAAELFLRNADRDDVAAHFEDRSYTYRELATESLRRAALWDGYRDRTKPPHIGVLLDNTPEYLFWLGAAAISRSAIVGINATYRGAELARLIDHCDCQVLVTSDTYTDVLADAPSSVKSDRVLRRTPTSTPDCCAADVDRRAADEDDAFLLIFTSGSTGFQSGALHAGRHHDRPEKRALGPRFRQAVYAAPMFHSLARCSLGSPARSNVGALRNPQQVLASGDGRHPPDGNNDAGVHRQDPQLHSRHAAVTDGASSPLELALGNKRRDRHLRERFQCTVRDSYGSTEEPSSSAAIVDARRRWAGRRQHAVYDPEPEGMPR